jgi:hypothetical protein
MHLFEILAPLRRAAPDLAESLVHKFEQPSDAVKKYPDGYDERQMEVPAAVVENAPKPGVDIEWDDVNFTWIPISEWVQRILPRKLETALQLYRYDVTPDPNKAPRECWPSTQELRSVLHQAGRYQGAAALKHLDRIPDPDVRLLVQIELCAALAGLNQIGGASIPRQTAENEKNAQPQLPMLTAESVRWRGRGSPRRVQVQTAQWIVESQTWAPPVRSFSAVYRLDGQAEQMQRQDPNVAAIHCEFDYDADGRPTAIWSLLDSDEVEQTAYSYDEGQRSVRIAKVTGEPETAIPPPSFGGGFAVSTTWVSIQTSDESYDVVGATSILKKYNSQNRPIEVSYFGPGHQLQAHKTLRWDSGGRLAHDQLILSFGDLFGPDSMPHWETTYRYDSEGPADRTVPQAGTGFRSPHHIHL